MAPSGVEINPQFYWGKKDSFSMRKTSYCGILVKVWRPHYQSNRRFYADKERRKKRDKKHITFKIPLSVSHRIRTEVPQKRDLWTVEERHRRNTADIVQAKERGNTGGRGVHRPHTYVHVLLGKHADTGNVVRNQTAHAGDSAVLTSMYSAMRRS